MYSIFSPVVIPGSEILNFPSVTLMKWQIANAEIYLLNVPCRTILISIRMLLIKVIRLAVLNHAAWLHIRSGRIPSDRFQQLTFLL